MRLNDNTGVFILWLGIAITMHSCSTPGPGLFDKKTPHEVYGQHITDAGLRGTALGRSWFTAAEQSLANVIDITIPYTETGYFAAEKPRASSWQFQVKRGERLHIQLSRNPSAGFIIYMDLWEKAEGNAKPKLLLAADTAGRLLEYDSKNQGTYILRLQPELLQSGEYTLSINTGPSLAFPLPAKAKTNIGSFWGAGRDRGARKHEGIDIFAPLRTPALAAANGMITQVGQNNLGGKVIFLRPQGKNYTLYYAHLDTQTVHEGALVQTGDTLGLVGNTGNARFTPSHLHFGIYTGSGAIDPFPFVNQASKNAAPITASLTNLGNTMRSVSKGKLYNEPDIKIALSTRLEDNTLLEVDAASGSLYKVRLPSGLSGFVSSREVATLSKPLRTSVVTASTALLDHPDTSAPKKMTLAKGESVNILAGFENFYFVSNKDDERGWIEKTTQSPKRSASK